MLPDLSVFWVIFFVMLLTVIVDRLLLRPITRVMRAREEAIRSARDTPAPHNRPEMTIGKPSAVTRSCRA